MTEEEFLEQEQYEHELKKLEEYYENLAKQELKEQSWVKMGEDDYALMLEEQNEQKKNDGF